MRIGITLTSSLNVGDEYIELTNHLSEKIAMKKDGIVYGGTDYGMMSKLAESYLDNGGNDLVGVMAKDLMAVTEGYKAHPKLTESYLEDTMEDRKAKIMSLADGFVILPGGYGTLEEIVSIIGSKANLITDKPIVLFNYKDFYSDFINFLNEMVKRKFSKINIKELTFVTDNLDDALNYLHSYTSSDLPQKFV